MQRIYNSRNYRSLLASKIPCCMCRDLQQQKLQKLTSQHQFSTDVLSSTIVEIIEAYQPCHLGVFLIIIYNSRNYRSLLARKAGIVTPLQIYNSRNYRSLLAKARPKRRFETIYNSRNYRSLLANLAIKFEICKSTIVEIIEAYQPYHNGFLYQLGSTIVEIIEAYQPAITLQRTKVKSTIVEIIEAYQPDFDKGFIDIIYNSRNY